jgi:hypothetical protein
MKILPFSTTNRRRSASKIVWLVAALSFFVSACGASQDHEHGPDTHTHEEEAAGTAARGDTAGTYVDTTGAFFDDTTGVRSGDHEHGPDTHTH